MKYLTLLFLAATLHGQTTNITLMWDDPEPGDSVVRYQVRYGHETNNLEFSQDIPVLTNLVTIENLNTLSNYYFVAIAINHVGIVSEPSNMVEYQGRSTPNPTLPPFNLRLVLGADRVLTWDYSIQSTNTFYWLYASTNLLRSKLRFAPSHFIGTNQMVAIRNLTPARKWTFAVVAQRFGIESEASNFISFEQPATPTTPLIGQEVDGGGFKLIVP